MKIKITNEFKEKFEKNLKDEMTKIKVPGMTVGIIHDSKIVYMKGFGARDFAEGKEANADTLYPIGSVSKSFTCVAIMKLMEMGKLNISDSVSKYIDFKVNDDIKIHHLMSHTSGIPDLGSLGAAFRDSCPAIDMSHIPLYPLTSWSDYYDLVNDAKNISLAKPGERFYYLNDGFTLLGQIIEKVSGITYENFVTEQILEPLEMKNSRFFGEDSEDENNSICYEVVDDKVVINPNFVKKVNTRFLNAAGGIISSVSDMMNYAKFYLNDGSFNGKQILEPKSISKMVDFHFIKDKISDAEPTEAGNKGYGYGLNLQENFYGHKLVSHNGSVLGGSATFSYIKDLDLAVISLANLRVGPNDIVSSAIARLMGEDVDNEWPTFRLKKHYDNLCGVYKKFKGFMEVEVIQKGAQLYIKYIATGNEEPIIPLDNQKDVYNNLDFYIPMLTGAKNLVQFTKDDDNNLSLHIERNRFYKKKK